MRKSTRTGGGCVALARVGVQPLIDLATASRYRAPPFIFLLSVIFLSTMTNLHDARLNSLSLFPCIQLDGLQFSLQLSVFVLAPDVLLAAAALVGVTCSHRTAYASGNAAPLRKVGLGWGFGARGSLGDGEVKGDATITRRVIHGQLALLPQQLSSGFQFPRQARGIDARSRCDTK